MQLTQRTLPLLTLLQAGGLCRRVPGWSRILSMLFPAREQAAGHVEVTQWGLTYLANPANYIDWNVLCLGAYEPDDLRMLARHAPPHAVCLDVGANIGHHSLFFAAQGWRVHAFEPNPQVWPEFEAKVAASGLRTITLNKVGLGDTETVLDFELESASNSGTGRFRLDGEEAAGSVAVGKLPIRNGDQFLREAGIERVDVIKMDIQGFEPEALAGLRKTIARDHPLLCVEISEESARKLGSFEAFRALFPEGYCFKTQRLELRGLVRQPVVAPYEGEGFFSLHENLFCFPPAKPERPSR